MRGEGESNCNLSFSDAIAERSQWENGEAGYGEFANRFDGEGSFFLFSYLHKIAFLTNTGV